MEEVVYICLFQQILLHMGLQTMGIGQQSYGKTRTTSLEKELREWNLWLQFIGSSAETTQCLYMRLISFNCNYFGKVPSAKIVYHPISSLESSHICFFFWKGPMSVDNPITSNKQIRKWSWSSWCVLVRTAKIGFCYCDYWSLSQHECTANVQFAWTVGH